MLVGEGIAVALRPAVVAVLSVVGVRCCSAVMTVAVAAGRFVAVAAKMKEA